MPRSSGQSPGPGLGVDGGGGLPPGQETTSCSAGLGVLGLSLAPGGDYTATPWDRVAPFRAPSRGGLNRPGSRVPPLVIMPRRPQQLFSCRLSDFPAESGLALWRLGTTPGHYTQTPSPCPGMNLFQSQMDLAVPGRPQRGPKRNKASWAPSQCLSVPVSRTPPHPSRPWHSNQCPLTSHLAISVNQLKLARCHKNIYTFYAIGAFKSSSCALLPRKLHPILDWTAQKGGTGCPRQGWAGAAEAALPGPELTTDPA